MILRKKMARVIQEIKAKIGAAYFCLISIFRMIDKILSIFRQDFVRRRRWMQLFKQAESQFVLKMSLTFDLKIKLKKEPEFKMDNFQSCKNWDFVQHRVSSAKMGVFLRLISKMQHY